MKQLNNTFDVSRLWPSLEHATTLMWSFVHGALFKVGQGLSGVSTTLQLGRMETVLNQMSDAELARIGITRSGIKRHAAFLLNYKYDGL